MIKTTNLEDKSSNGKRITQVALVMGLIVIAGLELYQSEQISALDKRILVAQAARLSGQPIDPSTITNVRDINKEQPKAINPFVTNSTDNQGKTYPLRPSIESATSLQQLFNEGKVQDVQSNPLAQSVQNRQDADQKTQTPN